VKINWWPPCVIILTDDLPVGRGAEAGFLNVKMRPKYEGDEGLLEHEFEHEWQGWLTLGLHPLLYRYWRWYRCRSEVEAYQVQMKYPRADGTYLTLDDAAWRLTNSGYDIELTLSEARELLKG